MNYGSKKIASIVLIGITETRKEEQGLNLGYLDLGIKTAAQTVEENAWLRLKSWREQLLQPSEKV